METLFSRLNGLHQFRRALQIIGFILFGLALAIIIIRLGGDILRLDLRHWRWKSIFTLIGFLCTMAMLLAMTYGWKAAIHFAGGSIGYRTAFQIYYRTNILRYLPGGVWNFPGRAFLAQQSGISLRVFRYATFFELFLLLISGGVVAIFTIGLKMEAPGFYILGVLIFCTSIFVALKVALHSQADSIKPDNRHITLRHLRDVSIIFLAYLFVWLAFSISIVALFQIVPGAVKPACIDIATSNIVSWATGFFSFAPAGLGVRELGFAELLSPSFAAQAILVSTLQRVIELCFELLFWMTSFIRHRG